MVRVAAVGALTKFALPLPSLRPSILTILRKCAQTDLDDAVRDRAVLALAGLENDGGGNGAATGVVESSFFVPDQVYDLDVLEERLEHYLSDQSGLAEPFQIAQVPTIPIGVVLEKKRQSMASQQQSVAAAATAPLVPAAVESAARSVRDITSIPEFVPFGGAFNPSPPAQPLTEAEAEYVVRVRKHLFTDGGHLVLEFEICNTVRELVLENVQVQVKCEASTASGTVLKAVSVIPIARLVYEDPASCYVAFEAPRGWLHGRPEVTFHSSLRFLARECDPDTFEPLEPGSADVYSLEAFDLGLGDYIRPRNDDFEADWSRLGQHEARETLALTAIGTIDEAVKAIKGLLAGARPFDQSDQVAPGSTVHLLMLSGTLYPNQGSSSSSSLSSSSADFALRARLAVTSSQPGVTMQISVRAADEETCQLLVNAIS